MAQRGRKRYPWVKLWFEDLSDPVPHQLTIAEKGCWWGIQILAGNSPKRGKLMLTPTKPMTVDHIAQALSLSPDERPILDKTIEKMLDFGELAWNDDCLMVINWKAKQDVYPSDIPVELPEPQDEPDEPPEEIPEPICSELATNSLPNGSDLSPQQQAIPSELTPNSLPNNSELAPSSLPISSELAPNLLPLDERRKMIDVREKTKDIAPSELQQGFYEEIITKLNTAPSGKEKIAILGSLYKHCCGRDPPYERIGAIVKRANSDHGYVAQLMWQAAVVRPSGDFLSYVQGMLRGEKRGGKGEKGRVSATRKRDEFAAGTKW